MTIFVFGINHKTAPVAVREQVAFSHQRIQQALQCLIAETALTEVVILSTCNRMEVYGCLTNGAADDSDPALIMTKWLAQFHQLPVALLEQHSYCYQQEYAVRHAMRVASGLDSMVLGESQILGQMKSAYAQAQQQMVVSGQLTLLFQHAFNAAKQVLTDTAIGENPVSVAFAAVSMSRQIFADLGQKTALLIGAGETIELVGLHLRKAGVKQIIVANRTLDRARKLAAKIDASVTSLAEISDHLPTADVVVSSTASQLPILRKGSVEQALRQRRYEPMLMVDIAVPRDIDAEVDDLEDVYLYTIDDLKDVVDENIKARQQQACIAESMIDAHVENFLDRLRARDAVDLIRSYRSKMEQLRDVEVAYSLNRLNQGDDAAHVLQMLGRNLINKIIHTPTVQLKKSSVAGRLESLSLMKQLFDLEH